MKIHSEILSVLKWNDRKSVAREEKNGSCWSCSVLHPKNFGGCWPRYTEYIFNIRNYVKQARDNLPHELSAIIPKSTFAESKAKAEIGTLRLQPKILKLKSICKD